METVMNKAPLQLSTDDRRMKLVQDVADALAEYFGDHQGDFGCHVQAVKMLVKAGPLRGHALEISSSCRMPKVGVRRRD
jgi:hypothetical protein